MRYTHIILDTTIKHLLIIYATLELQLVAICGDELRIIP